MAALKPKQRNRRRIVYIFVLICVLFAALVVRLGQLMIIKADELSSKAARQQTSDTSVSATRGDIVDRNMSQLAISNTTYVIWIRTSTVNKNGKTEEEIAENKILEAQKLSELLGMDYDDVMEVLNSTKTLVKLAKGLDEETSNLVKAENLAGVEISATSSRTYPLGAFLSQVIGFTNDDNQGTTGIELQYNSYLSGMDGRWIYNKDGSKNSLYYGVNKYYAAEDGYTVQLTIDEYIQSVVMEKIQACKETTNAKRVICMMMDPSTGEVLAMAQTDEYDLNNPREGITEADQEYLENASDTEKVSYWNKLWRNFCVCDTYEPGSTFKLITTSIGLETGATYMGEKFYCNGYIKIADAVLKCWDYPNKHGEETLQEAVENSCNPVMATISTRIGLTKFYEGLDTFGLTEKTGIDFPGESYNILQSKSTAGPVGLATMSYGQGIAVTPISLVTAISSIANEGLLMQPRLVKAIYDSQGNLVEEFEPTIRSRSVSKQTADDVLSIMEMVVSEGGGGKAKVSGYRIGGKTGTASKPDENGGYSDTDVYASFIGVAPVDDPKFVILVIVDTPQGVKYGSSTAAPCAKAIMEEVLPYMEISPNYTDAELKALQSKQTTVPDVSGKSVEDAIGILGGKELEYALSPEVEDYTQMIVTDQYPKAGTTVEKNSEVVLYYEVVEGANSDIELIEEGTD